MKKKILKIMRILLCVGLLGGMVVLGINGYVKAATKDRILTSEQASQLEGVDCILVLGCYVHDDGDPSDMLRDRLRRGLELYELGAAPKLLMSGDHGRESYDEVDAMKTFAVEAGVSSQDVFMDLLLMKACVGPKRFSRQRRSLSLHRNITCTGHCI